MSATLSNKLALNLLLVKQASAAVDPNDAIDNYMKGRIDSGLRAIPAKPVVSQVAPKTNESWFQKFKNLFSKSAPPPTAAAGAQPMGKSGSVQLTGYGPLVARILCGVDDAHREALAMAKSAAPLDSAGFSSWSGAAPTGWGATFTQANPSISPVSLGGTSQMGVKALAAAGKLGRFGRFLRSPWTLLGTGLLGAAGTIGGGIYNRSKGRYEGASQVSNSVVDHISGMKDPGFLGSLFGAPKRKDLMQTFLSQMQAMNPQFAERWAQESPNLNRFVSSLQSPT